MAAGASKRTGRPSDSGKDAGEPPEGVRVGVGHGERAASVVRGGGISAFLRDADGDDRDVAPDKALVDGLADDDLLWVDVDSSQKGAVARVRPCLPVHLESMSVAAAHKPFIHDFGESFVIGVLPVPRREPAGQMLISRPSEAHNGS